MTNRSHGLPLRQPATVVGSIPQNTRSGSEFDGISGQESTDSCHGWSEIWAPGCLKQKLGENPVNK
jgi:hypothetical protein